MSDRCVNIPHPTPQGVPFWFDEVRLTVVVLIIVVDGGHFGTIFSTEVKSRHIEVRHVVDICRIKK